MKNQLIRTALRLVKPWIRPHTSDRAFLVVSTTGLGDTLWATPALQSLRDSFPTARIELLTTPLGHELLASNPTLDALHIRTPWRRRYSDILLFHTSQRLVLPSCSLLGATRIVGTAGQHKGLDDLLTDRLPPLHQHEIERRLAIVEHIGGHITTRSLSYPHTETRDPRLVALHPGAKEAYRRWPISHFIELGRRLNRPIVVTGTPGEPTEEIARAIPGATSFQGTLTELAHLLARCSLVISNDTGPLHLAIAVGTPALGLYAPTDPTLCGPYHAPHAKIIAKRPTCRPCLRKQCPEPFCLRQISVDEVLRETL